MLRKYVRTPQPDFVTPLPPTRPGSDSRTFTPPAPTFGSSPPREQPRHKHWQTVFSYDSTAAVAVLAEKIATKLSTTAMKSLPVQIHSIHHLRYRPAHGAPLRHQRDEISHTSFHLQPPAIQHPFDTCVSYASATTTRQIRHLSDTNRVFLATTSVECPICVSTPTRPTFALHSTTKSVSLISPPPTPPCNSFVSYGPDTTMLLMLRVSDTNRFSPDMKRVACSYLSVAPVRPISPPPHHDEIRQPRPAPEISPPWNSLVQYEPATAVERMERLSDTNHPSTDTNGVPRPIWHWNAPTKIPAPFAPTQHYETRPASQRLFVIRPLTAQQSKAPPMRHPKLRTGQGWFSIGPHVPKLFQAGPHLGGKPWLK